MAAATLRNNWAISDQTPTSSETRVLTVRENISEIPSQPQAVADAFDEMFTRLNAIRKLKSDWDSYGATPPSKRSISMLQSVIGKIVLEHLQQIGVRAIPFVIVPIPVGGVQSEWRGTSGKFIEVEISPEGTFSYLVQKGQGKAEEHHNVAEAVVLEQILSVVA